MFSRYVNMSQMNKSFIKFATDFGPLAIFFFYYYNNDKNLSIAIPPLFGKENTNDAINKWYLNYIFWRINNLF